MDPSKLVDPNIPFDQTKLILLDNIVTTFYTTKNSNEVRNKTNKN